MEFVVEFSQLIPTVIIGGRMVCRLRLFSHLILLLVWPGKYHGSEADILMC